VRGFRAGQAGGELREGGLIGHGGEGWAKFLDLGDEGVDILPGDKGIHLIKVAVSPDHVEGIGADGPGRAQHGERFHWGRAIIAFENARTNPIKAVWRGFRFSILV